MTIICVVGRGYVPANTERRCNVTALQRRCNDVVATLCICWDISPGHTTDTCIVLLKMQKKHQTVTTTLRSESPSLCRDQTVRILIFNKAALRLPMCV